MIGHDNGYEKWTTDDVLENVCKGVTWEMDVRGQETGKRTLKTVMSKMDMDNCDPFQLTRFFGNS